MTEWKWVDLGVVLAIHEMQLSAHGGLEGVLNMGPIESALARPQHLCAYGEPDAADLAAAYVYGLARNHGFADGNKRTGWVTARFFLAYNGFAISLDLAAAVHMVNGVASGEVSEEELAVWLRDRISRA